MRNVSLRHSSLVATQQGGASLIETMVGILIGLIVVAVVYNTMILAEEHKRTTIGVADAQVTGQLTQFILGRELANAGNALQVGIQELAGCSDWRLKPIPIAIRAGATNNDSDELTVFYSTSTRVVHPVVVPGATTPVLVPVTSPNGFAENDFFLLTDQGTTCHLGKVAVNGIAQWASGNPFPPAAPGGHVQLTTVGPVPAMGGGPGTTARVINLGPTVRRMHYRVDPAKGQLYRVNVNPDPSLLLPQPVVPIAQNVVLVKAQYGVDIGVDTSTSGNGTVDCWTPADFADTCGNGVDYTGPVDPKDGAPGAGGPFAEGGTVPQMRTRFRSVKAVRVAIVVRSDEQTKANANNAGLVGQTAWLFNCAANDATCLGRIQIDNTVLQDYGRYRIYEATIPLRNAIWSQP